MINKLPTKRIKTISRAVFNVLPTKWRQKPAGIHKKGNYVIFALFICKINKQRDSDVILFHIYGRRFLPPSCRQNADKSVTVLLLKYALLVSL